MYQKQCFLLNEKHLTLKYYSYLRFSFISELFQDLKDFMDNAKEGFIYFSLGSNVRSKELNQATLTAIVQAFKEVPYKIVWKFEGDDLPGKPDNVKLVRWAPQQIVLSKSLLICVIIIFWKYEISLATGIFLAT